jgi:hypothetical protein
VCKNSWKNSRCIFENREGAWAFLTGKKKALEVVSRRDFKRILWETEQ